MDVDWKMSKTRYLFPFFFLSCGFAAVAAERVGDWWVGVPSDVLGKMAMPERTCAERALKQLDADAPRAAANEWKRFNTEFMVSAHEEALAWASFLQAYSLDKANDAYKALELYAETLELYPDSKAACAALFFRGQCYGRNGALAKEMDDYRELISTEAFGTHPLVYAARNRLADRLIAQKKLESAMEQWRAVKELKRAGNPSEWDRANENLAQLQNLANPSTFLEDACKKVEERPDIKRNRLRDWKNNMWYRCENPAANLYFESHLGKAKDVGEARTRFRKIMCASFLKLAKPFYAATNTMWDYMMEEYNIYRNLEPANVDKIVQRIGESVRKSANAKERGELAKQHIRLLCDLGKTKDAKLFVDLIVDPAERDWAYVDIGWRDRNAADIVEHLKPLEGHPDPSTSGAAKRNHARVCMELTKEWDLAIQLLEDAPNPPDSLWKVADCHRNAARQPRAQAVLDEIVSMFPPSAADAMLRKGDWYKDDGDKRNAIGCYRRILAHADWKKAGAASQAHQRLEALGIATGGAVLNDVR